jgi:hypothetical protein
LEGAAREDKENSKECEIVLVDLASFLPIWALVIKALHVKEALWLGQTLIDKSWDLSLLNKFFMSKVVKLADSSKAVIFIHHTWSSRA